MYHLRLICNVCIVADIESVELGFYKMVNFGIVRAESGLTSTRLPPDLGAGEVVNVTELLRQVRDLQPGWSNHCQ